MTSKSKQLATTLFFVVVIAGLTLAFNSERIGLISWESALSLVITESPEANSDEVVNPASNPHEPLSEVTVISDLCDNPGMYYTINSLASSKPIGIVGNATTDGAFAEQQDAADVDGQKWHLISHGNDEFSFINAISGMCLQSSGLGSGNGRLAQGSYSGSSHQTWELTRTSSAWIIKNTDSDLVLDLSGNSSAAGANILQWSAHGGANQEWLIETANFEIGGSCTTDLGQIGVWTSDCLCESSVVSDDLIAVGDFDLDGITDDIDLDDDNDGITDIMEIQGCSGSMAYEYYNAAPSGNTVDNIPTSGADFTGEVSEINVDNLFESLTPGQGNQFSIRYTGRILISEPADYTFYTASDDGSKLYVNATEVVSNDGLHGTVERNGTINLSEGFHDLELLFFENSGAEVLTFQYSSPTISKRDIPFSELYLPTCPVVDVDNDGFTNDRDLDSDGDGCSDAFEAGATTDLTSNFQFPSSSDTNSDGLSETVDTDSDGFTDYVSSFSSYAISGAINTCSDFDNDGIGDVFDLDDDNDGITDAEESPSCFASASSVQVSHVSTSLTNYNSSYPFTALYDGNTSSMGAYGAYNTLITDQTIYEIELTHPVELESVTITYNYSVFRNNAVYKWQAWNGSSWIDVTNNITASQGTNNSATDSFIETGSFYTKYRIRGISGRTYYNRVYEISIEIRNFDGSAYPLSSCSEDSDSDGAFNHQDLDSDGDGCSDALESGATTSQVNNFQFPNSTDTNGDGLSETVDSNSDGIVDYSSTYSLYANSSALNVCSDFDNDLVPDIYDLDDDNDGVPDAIESPSCFASPSDVHITEVNSSLTNYSGSYDFANLYDGNATTIGAWGSYNTVITDQTIYEFDLSHPVELESVTITYNYSVFRNNAVYKWQAWNGSSWVDVSDDITASQGTNNSRVNILNETNGLYAKYRLRGISGRTYYNRIYEITFGIRNFNSSAYPLAACSSDIDSDGQLNHFDLDSDGDNCSDGYEAGATTDTSNDFSFGSVGVVFTDANGDGLADEVDTDQNGLIDYTSNFASLANNENVVACADTDSDGVGDIYDLDDDNDGILDEDELMELSSDCTTSANDFGHSVWAIQNASQAVGTITSGDTSIDVTFDSDQSTLLGRVNYFYNGGNSVCSSSSYSGYHSVQSTCQGNHIITFSEPVVNPRLVISSLNRQLVFPEPVKILTCNNSCTEGEMVTSFQGNETELTVVYEGIYSSITFTGSSYEYWASFGVGIDGLANDITLGDYVQAGSTRLFATLDTDSDNIPNHLDLDSDGDGCSDAKEAGATDSSTENFKFPNTPDVNADGLNDSVDSDQNGETDYNSTYSYLALSEFLNACNDFDNDGVSDVQDIDDDNDGILDAIESPDCFMSASDVTIIEVSTSLTNYNTSYDFSGLYDGDLVTISAYGNYNTNITGESVYELTLSHPVELSAVSTVYNYNVFRNNATYKWQAWDGSSWTDVTSVLNGSQTTNNTDQVEFNQTGNQYTKYRILGVSGRTYYNRIREFLIEVGSFNASLYPLASCVANLDGDANLNHMDLDADGDGCSDAFESGTSGDDSAEFSFTSADANQDGLVDELDTNQDGQVDFDTYPEFAADAGKDACLDSDSDGVNDLIDIDDDNDGVLDTDESCAVIIGNEIDLSGAVTSQIADYSNGYLADRTTDGNVNTMSISAGNTSTDWWQIDLQQNYEIGKVEIAPRVGVETSIASSYVLISNTPFIGNSLSAARENAKYEFQFEANTQSLSLQEIFLDQVIRGRYVRIQKSGNNYTNRNYLEIAEVDIFLGQNCVLDTDGDNIANSLDLDSDGDGCSDALEANATTDTASDYQFSGTDANNDGLVDVLDSDLNGIPDYTSSYTDYALSDFENACSDFDLDGIGDVFDLDDDNDGILDSKENECPKEISEFNWHGSAAGNITTSGSNIDVNGNTWANAYSDESFDLPFRITGRVTSVSNGMLGVIAADATETTNWNDGGYKFQFNNGNGMYVRHGSTVSGWHGPSMVGKDFMLEVDKDGNMTYWNDGELKYSGTIPVTSYKITLSRGWFSMSNLYVTTSDIQCADSDNDGNPNSKDLDSDGDGCSDALEAEMTTILTADYQFTSADANGDGLVDELDSDLNGEPDDEPELAYVYNSEIESCLDSDGDGVTDINDIDDDNDGVLDTIEDKCTKNISELNWHGSAATNINTSEATMQVTGNAWANAYSDESFELPILIEGTITSATNGMLGIVDVNAAETTSWNDGGYKFQFNNGNGMYVRHGSSESGWHSPSMVGRAFSLEVDQNGAITYSHNGTVNYTGTIPVGEYKITLSRGPFNIDNFTVTTTNPECVDVDVDGLPNSLDLDSDGDGCSDAYEAGATEDYSTDFSFSSDLTSGDNNANGLPDEVESTTDGEVNYNSTYGLNATDDQENPCDDIIECFSDEDCDGDGFTDIEEEIQICGLTADPFDYNSPYQFQETTGTGTTDDEIFQLEKVEEIGFMQDGETYNLSVKAGHTLTLGSNITVHHLTIKEDAILIMSEFGIKVTGNLNVKGEIVSDSGHIYMEDDCNAQIITGTNTIRLHELTINNALGVTLDVDMEISGPIHPELGTFDLNSKGLTLVSEPVDGAVQTGSISEIKTGADVLGDIKIQRYVESLEDGYRLIGPPIKNLTVGDFADDFVTTGFPGADWPTHWFTNIKYYQEHLRDSPNVLGGYKNVENMNEPLVEYHGYWSYFPPSTSVNLLEVEGEFYKGDITYDLTLTNTEVPSEDGWHCIINPYPSAIDMKNGCVEFTDVSKAIYVLDHTLGGNWRGEYVVYNDGISVNGGESTVASFQAIMVQATGPNPSITFSECAKTDEQGIFYRSAEAEEKEFIKFSMKNEIKSYETVVAVEEDATEEYDPNYDARRKSSVMFSLSTLSGADTLSINTISSLEGEISIPFLVSAPFAGSYELEISELTVSTAGTCLFVEDLETNEIMKVEEGESMSFQVGEDNYYEERFLLHSTPTVTVGSSAPFCSDANSGSASVELVGEDTASFKWSDFSNTVLHTSEGTSSELSGVASGTYYVQVVRPDHICNTEVLEIEVADGEGEVVEINSTPDYCSGGFANIKVKVMGAESWTVSLFHDYELIQNGSSETLVELNELEGLVYDVIVETPCSRNEYVLDLTDPDAVIANFDAPVEVIIENIGVELDVESLSENADRNQWFLDEFFKGEDDILSLTFDEVGHYSLRLNSSNEFCDDVYEQEVMVSAASMITENLEKDFLTVNRELEISIVRLNDNSGKIDVTLYDSKGSKVVEVYGTNKNKISIDKQGLSTGVYVLEIKTEEGQAMSSKYTVD